MHKAFALQIMGAFERARKRVAALVRSHIVIKRSDKAIFGLITNLVGYHQWLPGARIVVSGTAVSGELIGPGTCYEVQGGADVISGAIVGWQPPTQVTFQQYGLVKVHGLRGRVTVQIDYVLKQDGLQTDVMRDVTIHTSGVLFLLKLELIYTVQRESKRMLRMMKTYLEARG